MKTHPRLTPRTARTLAALLLAAAMAWLAPAASAQSTRYTRSSPWRPLDTYEQRVHYRYYPNSETYYDPSEDLYYYRSNGHWNISSTGPTGYNTGNSVWVDLDGYDPRPYHSIVYDRYPRPPVTSENFNLKTGERTFSQYQPNQPGVVDTREDINARTGERRITTTPSTTDAYGTPINTTREDINGVTGERQITTTPRTDYNNRGYNNYNDYNNGYYNTYIDARTGARSDINTNGSSIITQPGTSLNSAASNPSLTTSRPGMSRRNTVVPQPATITAPSRTALPQYRSRVNEPNSAVSSSASRPTLSNSNSVRSIPASPARTLPSVAPRSIPQVNSRAIRATPQRTAPNPNTSLHNTANINTSPRSTDGPQVQRQGKSSVQPKLNAGTPAQQKTQLR